MNEERRGRTLRRMAPGALGGRTEQAQALPARPRAQTYRAGGSGSYRPLDPWGVAGDSDWSLGWHGLFQDTASAAAKTGPSMHLGLTGGEVGLVWNIDGEDDSGYIEWSYGTDSTPQGIGLWLSPYSTGDANGYTFLAVARDADLANSGAYCSMQLPTGQRIDLEALYDPAHSKDYSEIRVTHGDQQVRFHDDQTNGEVFIQLHVSEDNPTAPAGGARIYAKRNGSDKIEWLCRFTTGSPQVIATEP